MVTNTILLPEEQTELLEILKSRFHKNMKRHQELDWKVIEEKLILFPSKIWSINEMEKTGGEPDVIYFDENTNQIWFVDCAAESPKDRRSLAYDYDGQTSRKEHQPKNNALDVAVQMQIDLLTEAEYRLLQSVGNFDQKTSSWLKTPQPIRDLGGAIFGDYRYGTVFIYHNGAQSYYAARGFRGIIKV
ncbi:Protein of unknown function [Algoriella xinjiangensis]|uniref:DUF4256 domain-containing protein n=1 Tax=Algoriella xinjiangensis TaxID=684065 RepID=A0A1I4YZW3_9FLAO|nr:DUF4256 domain-containing protein [Algoriella xinjiangensis]SFN43586.1 Protein of unknown function [Algoriella xinjiangensis]VDH16625.1 Uncharacterised protein [Algoriella xinjiangensis]